MATQLGQDKLQILLATIHEVVSHHISSGYARSEPLLLAVGTQQSASPRLELTDEEWDNICINCGAWEWIDGELDGESTSDRSGKKERNEFGGESDILTQ